MVEGRFTLHALCERHEDLYRHVVQFSGRKNSLEPIALSWTLTEDDFVDSDGY